MNFKLKIAFFVEGKVELVFLSRVLSIIFENNVEIKCITRNKYDFRTYNFPNADAYVFCSIYDVGGHEKVISAIKDNAKRNKEEGFTTVFGLHDIFGQQIYENLWKKNFPQKRMEVNKNLVNLVKGQLRNTLVHLNLNIKTSLHFAVMEIESWLLAFYIVFNRVDGKITFKTICRDLKCDIKKIDPEEYFLHPAKNLSDIKHLRYKKSNPERTTNHIAKKDVMLVLKSQMVNSFNEFYYDIKSQIP